MEIGERLKEARETKGISLESLQETTKIQKRYLKAIETNEFQVLPGKFYTRAFIREYASAVGLDPEIVMEEHKSELPTFEDESAVQYSRVQKSKKEASQKSSGSSKIFPTILTVALVIGILLVAWVFLQNGGDAENEGSSPQNDSNDEINVPADSSDQGDSEEETQENTESEGNNDEDGSGSSYDEENPEKTEEEKEKQSEQEMNVELSQEGTGGFPEHIYEVTGVEKPTVTIEWTGAAYMDVQSPKGGEGLITAGEYGPSDSPLTLDFEGDDELYIKTGNAPGTVVKINDQEVPFPNPELSTQKLLLQFQK
ncbi:helix-turn-helix domain-containing protein [Halobacillus litoralis]|nr:helix-turn-helix domain-containing protein [Halobacillus litoralis]